MSQQSKSWQTKYLAERKDHSDLYFYPEAQLPPKMRENRLSDGWAPVCYPGQWLPVVPVGDDPAASRRLIEMLCHLLKLCIPHMMEIAPVITDRKCLTDTKAKYYTWTDEITMDVICACCYAVERVPHTIAEESGEWICADCLDSGRWHEAYKEPIYEQS